MFKQVERFFFEFFLFPFPPCSVCDTTKETAAIKACHIHIIFSHYWIKTNTDVSLIRFQQMSCFMWRCIPSLTWNNLILPPWIMPLHWLIFLSWLFLMHFSLHGVTRRRLSAFRVQTEDSSPPFESRVRLFSQNHTCLGKITICVLLFALAFSSATDLCCTTPRRQNVKHLSSVLYTHSGYIGPCFGETEGLWVGLLLTPSKMFAELLLQLSEWAG